jgi:hypothetical protein
VPLIVMTLPIASPWKAMPYRVPETVPPAPMVIWLFVAA